MCDSHKFSIYIHNSFCIKCFINIYKRSNLCFWVDVIEITIAPKSYEPSLYSNNISFLRPFVREFLIVFGFLIVTFFSFGFLIVTFFSFGFLIVTFFSFGFLIVTFFSFGFLIVTFFFFWFFNSCRYLLHVRN